MTQNRSETLKWGVSNVKFTLLEVGMVQRKSNEGRRDFLDPLFSKSLRWTTINPHNTYSA